MDAAWRFWTSRRGPCLAARRVTFSGLAFSTLASIVHILLFDNAVVPFGVYIDLHSAPDPEVLAQIDRDLAAWRGKTINATEFLAFASELGKERAVSILRLTSDSVQLVAGRAPRIDPRCPVRTQPLNVLLRHLALGVPGMAPRKVAFLVLNWDDFPTVHDPEACKRYLEGKLGAELSASYLESSASGWIETKAPSRVPVFSFAKVPVCSRDILYPWPDLFYPLDAWWPCTQRLFDGPSARGPPFEKRKAGVVWRGARTSPLRDVVARWASAHTDANFEFSDQIAARLSMGEQLEYRAILDMDGFSYSKRLAWMWGLSGAAVVRTGIFRDVLLDRAKAGEDYVYFEPNERSFRAAVDRLMTDSEFARRIAENGARFGSANVRPEVWVQYTLQLVCRYATSLEFSGDVPMEAWDFEMKD